MKVKSIITGIIIVLISGAIVYILHSLNSRTGGAYNSLDAVPMDAVVVVQSPSFNSVINPILDQNHVYDQLCKLPSFLIVDTVIREINSIAANDKSIKKLISESKFQFSLHKTGKERINFIYYLNFNGNTWKSKVESVFNTYFANRLSITSRKYEGFTVSDMTIKGKSENHEWAFSTVEDLMIISPSSILLENALRQVKQEKKIYHSQEFKDVQQTTGKNVDGNVFINYKYLPDALNIYFRDKYNPVHTAIRNFATWAGLDLHVKHDAIMLSGFSHLKDSLNTFLNLFSNQAAQKTGLYNVLPSNSNTFFVVAVENFSEYILKYNDHLNFLGDHPDRKAYNKKVQTQLDFSFYEDFYQYIDNEFGFTICNFTTLNESQDLPFVIIKTKSGDKIRQSIEKIIKAEASRNKENPGLYKQDLRLDGNTRFVIYKLPLENAGYSLLGHFFDFPENNYAAIIDNFLILGTSPRALSKFMHFKILGKTLVNNPVFHDFSTLLSEMTNVFFYTNIPKSLNLYRGLLKDDVISGIKDHNDIFQKVQSVGIQFNVANKRMFTNAIIQYNKQYNENAHTVWETLLDTALDFKPVFVKNHYTQENEIFVQDLKNNIYLINKVGRVLWKLPINGQINSEIYQVDYYRNGKLQYLFSTPSRLYLIDREGNFVERYPIQLPSKASAGMSLFDYDNNYNYRIFIPTKDKKVNLYNIKGRTVDGWEFDKAEHVVRQTIKHFRVDTKDYIVFSDGFRLYILNRRGHVRVRVNDLVYKSKNNQVYLDTHSEKAKLVTTSEDGTIHKIFFDGTIEKQKIKDYDPDHFFDFNDVNADGNNDYIFLTNDKLEIYEQNGDEVFSKTFTFQPSHPPAYYHFSYKDRKIGITAKGINKIYLFNKDGTMYGGFPLQGNTPFSIGKLSATSRFNLIVGNNHNFLLNYSVQ